jgi:hypothetical protein
MQNIIKDIEKRLSTDAIINKHLNKKANNKDDILKVIKSYKWDQRIKHGRKGI